MCRNAALARAAWAQSSPDYTLEIAPILHETSPEYRFPKLAYNGKVQGPLLRLREGKEVTIDVINPGPEPELCTGTVCFCLQPLMARMKRGRR